jgi:hypothetical protein
LIISGVPLAAFGVVIALAVSGKPFSISAAVSFLRSPESRRDPVSALITFDAGELSLSDQQSIFIQEQAVELDYLKALKSA